MGIPVPASRELRADRYVLQDRCKIWEALAAPEQWAHKLLLCRHVLGVGANIGNPALESHLTFIQRKTLTPLLFRLGTMKVE